MKKWVLAALVLVLAGAGAWVIAYRVESPEQVAARAQPPAPDPVVASLERGYLYGPISMTTVAQYERTVAIRPPASLAGVVTFIQTPAGETLHPGSVLIRANGRPVFVLPGAFALYRDIQPGDSGDDVAAVQAGLRLAGYSIGDNTGVYGAGTQAAIRKMYRASGYVAPEVAVAAEPREDTTDDPPADPGAGADETNTTSLPGPQVLQTEIIMTPELPAIVQSVVPVGAQLSTDADLVTLAAGPLILSTTLPSDAVGALAVGASGTFTDAAGGTGIAQVSAISPNPATAETVVFLSVTGSMTTGTAYVVSVGNPAAEAMESLLAPIAAVVARSGRSYVYLRDGGVFIEVEVQVIGSVGGVAAIDSLEPTVPLEPGVEVRIG